MELNEQALDTLRISQRITMYLLDAIDENHLTDKAGGKGRSVGETLAHLHNVRLMWLGVSAPALQTGLEKIEKESAHSKQLLSDNLTVSGMAMEKLLELGLNDGRIKNFKPHPIAFLGYIVAHEAHHRGQVLLALKQSGHAVDKSITYGMWEWGKR